MSRCQLKFDRWAYVGAATVSALLLMTSARPAQAQTPIGLTQAVGGVLVDADGVLKNLTPVESAKLRSLRLEHLAELPGDLNAPTKLRMISLRGLQEAIAASQKAGQKNLPDSVRYLAGLQRVQYLFVDPEGHDILLAGPADGWKVNDQGMVVGRTNGRPVILLDDLLVALRGTNDTRHSDILCSIDPTAEGKQRLDEFNSRQTKAGDIQAKLGEMEKLLGMQKIRVGGVPDTSHFARVLVSADYRMKRLGMNLDKAPIKGLPSYLDLAPTVTSKSGAPQPRWWLTASYDSIGRDPEGLAWEVRGAGVKCMTEDSVFSDSGHAQTTGKSSPAAEKWAGLMTAKYGELSDHEPVFAELRNCMDLAIVATLISRENLLDKADCRLKLLTDADRLPLEKYGVPKQVDSIASFVKKGHSYVVQVSGGVKFQPWQLVEHRENIAAVGETRTKALERTKGAAKSSGIWWSN